MEDGTFNLETFYHNVLSLFEDPSDTWYKETIAWWEMYVPSTIPIFENDISYRKVWGALSHDNAASAQSEGARLTPLQKLKEQRAARRHLQSSNPTTVHRNPAGNTNELSSTSATAAGGSASASDLTLRLGATDTGA